MQRSHDVDVDVDTNNSQESSSPLLSNDGLRQRPLTSQDVEQGGRHSRMLDRNAAFHQSRGRWGVQRLSRQHRGSGSFCCCLRRIWHEWILGDWFHRLAYQKTIVLMALLFLIYTSIVVFFGFVYLGVSMLGRQVEINPDDGSKKIIAFCDMDINDHMEALYFSLSTMTTIGYGVSDYYFGGCWTPLLLVLWQVCSAITFDAVAVGLLFHRISRGHKRGKTITFSNKAVIQRVKGVPHFMFRIGELRKYHLLEASVRCYCIRHERLPIQTSSRQNEEHSETSRSETQELETTHFISRRVKLIYPDENYGSSIWMGLPQVIVHRLDDTSPLSPTSPIWYDAHGAAHEYPRKEEGRKGSKEDSLALPNSDDPASKLHMEDIEHFLLDRDAEIVVLVEGTDEGTGAATQARHSYKTTDIAWNYTFAPCIQPYRSQRQEHSDRDPVCSIDFSRFHDIVPAPPNCDACAYVCS